MACAAVRKTVVASVAALSCRKSSKNGLELRLNPMTEIQVARELKSKVIEVKTSSNPLSKVLTNFRAQRVARTYTMKELFLP